MTDGLKNLITEFMGRELIGFFQNCYTGNVMVEYRSCGRIQTVEAIELGRRIMRHKRDIMEMDRRIAERAA